MSYRTLLINAILAMGASLAGLAQADIVAVDSGIAVKESDGAAPARGMTMSQVTSKFGAPSTKVPAVGNPPISRWEYPGFVVYFERDHVIHSVVSESGAPASEPASNAPAAPPAPAESPAAVEPPAPAEHQAPMEQPQPPAAATPQSPARAAPQAAESAPPPADPAADGESPPVP
jgi:hypothetical protein